MFFKVGCALEWTGGLVKREVSGLHQDTKLPRYLDSEGLGQGLRLFISLKLQDDAYVPGSWTILGVHLDKLVLRVPFSPPIPKLFQDHSVTWLSYGYAHSCTWNVFIAIVVWMTIPLPTFSYSPFIYKWTHSWFWLIEAGLLWQFAWILSRRLLDPLQLWPLFTSPALLSCHPKEMSGYLHWSI